jgi:hypothetical protein
MSYQLRALERPDVLNMTFQFAGVKEWLFVGAVCKAWAAVHSKATSGSQHEQLHLKVTRYGAVTTLGRAVYASDCDPTLKVQKLAPLSKAAAFGGSTEVLVWARAEAGSRWSGWQEQLCIAAASGNQLATLQWLRGAASERPWVNVQQVARRAAECADLPLLQWIIHQQEKWTETDVLTVCVGAAAGAAAEKLSWLRLRFPEHMLVDHKIACASIKVDCVDALHWLAAGGFIFYNPVYTDYATKHTQFAALRYLVEETSCHWRPEPALKAAAGVNAAALHWLRDAAASHWDDDMVRYLLCIAGRCDNLAAVKWLTAAAGAPWPQHFFVWQQQQQVLSLGGTWALRTMQWAISQGCPWGVWPIDRCVTVCSLPSTASSLAAQDAITWAHAAGCPCDNKLHRLAAVLQHGRLNRGGTSRTTATTRRRRWHAPLFRVCCTQAGNTQLLQVLKRLLMALLALLAVLVTALVILTRVDVSLHLQQQQPVQQQPWQEPQPQHIYQPQPPPQQQQPHKEQVQQQKQLKKLLKQQQREQKKAQQQRDKERRKADAAAAKAARAAAKAAAKARAKAIAEGTYTDDDSSSTSSSNLGLAMTVYRA